MIFNVRRNLYTQVFSFKKMAAGAAVPTRVLVVLPSEGDVDFGSLDSFVSPVVSSIVSERLSVSLVRKEAESCS